MLIIQNKQMQASCQCPIKGPTGYKDRCIDRIEALNKKNFQRAELYQAWLHTGSKKDDTIESY